jgi:ribose 5-phosphate isomerase A
MSAAGDSASPGVRAAAGAAALLVPDGAKVGLGSGRASAAFVAQLAERVRGGLSVSCVATSKATEAQARGLGLTMIELGEDVELDIIVDGADEVTPSLDLVKGRGGALVRERIVAGVSRRQIIIVSPDKLVGAIGETGPIPVEIIPLALGPCRRRFRALGLAPNLRPDPADRSRPFVSDNGNLTLDVTLATPLADPAALRALEASLRSIPGVVDTGLFLGTAERVLVGHADGRVDTRVRAD